MDVDKRRTGNLFEDFEVGMVFRHATPRTLSDGDRSLYIGLTGSRHAAFTAASADGTWPLEDLLVFHIAFGKTVPDISLNARANLGYADVRFLTPVHAGDTVTVDSEVIGLKTNSSGKDGVVYVRSTARNQRGATVLSWIRWVMIPRRSAAVRPVEPVIPELPETADLEGMSLAHLAARAAWVPRSTAVQDCWADYMPGERIDHPSAMTINASDHSIATRLYQNTARAHFDDQLMAGKRLVYGGFVISVCNALSYEGFENALGMLAINGGTHVAPCFAGDTICCASRIVDRFPLADPRIGGLRVRTIAAKNIGDSGSISFPEPGAGRPAHASEVVLDLDYTIALPTAL